MSFGYEGERLQAAKDREAKAEKEALQNFYHRQRPVSRMGRIVWWAAVLVLIADVAAIVWLMRRP